MITMNASIAPPLIFCCKGQVSLVVELLAATVSRLAAIKVRGGSLVLCSYRRITMSLIRRGSGMVSKLDLRLSGPL